MERAEKVFIKRRFDFNAERGERKKIVSLLKFAIAQNHQSMGKIYHLYTFQKSVSKVFGSVDSAKMIDEDVLLWIQWIAICSSSPKISVDTNQMLCER